MELDLPKMKAGELKEKSLRTTLQNVQAQGHPYVELRVEGKKNKLALYCILCPAFCYSDSCLFEHLKGRRHTERLVSARATLLKPNPWPFNDGMLFFHDHMAEQSQSQSVPASDKGKNKCVDVHSTVAGRQSSLKIDGNANRGKKSSSSTLDADKPGGILVIPEVMRKGEASNLLVRHIGFGKISARFREKNGPTTISRIWCEWLGNVDSTTQDFRTIPKHNFAIVTFSYDYNLGRFGLVDAFNFKASKVPELNEEDVGVPRAKRRKLVSDAKVISEALRNQDHSQSSNSSKSVMLATRDDDKLARIIASKTMRKRLRKQYRRYAERACHICDKKMLPGKDVAALLNRKTGMLVCSSRNFYGLFHMFHISCLIQWLLLFEAVIVFDQIEQSCIKSAPERKKIVSAFCPECQGTGVLVNRGLLEGLHSTFNEIREDKIKVCDFRDAWVESPEKLDNCSIGFQFPLDYAPKYEEEVEKLKILHFYRAIDQ